MITAPTLAASRKTYELLRSGMSPRPRRDGAQVRVGHHNRRDEDQLGEPEGDPDALGSPVAPRHGDADQEGGGDGDRHRAREAEDLAHSGDTGVLGEKRPDPRDEKG